MKNARIRKRRRQKKSNVRWQQNISYILNVEKSLLAAHMDPECCRVALKIIEEFLSAEEVFFWAEINQHEKRCWSSAKDQAEGDISSGEIFPGFFHLTKNGKGVVCYHIYSQLPISSQEKKMLLEKGVNNLMIIPIRWINGTAFGILGAINMKRHWKTCLLYTSRCV